MTKIQVLLADDHSLFREGLAGILKDQPDFEVVGEAADGLEAVVKARELKPDLIVMDVCMPTCNGVEATQRIKREMESVTVVMLTVSDDDEKLFEAIKNGAQGYILKNIRSRELISLLRGAVRGEAAITPEIGGRMLEEFRRLAQSTLSPPDSVPYLTQREQEVLSLVALNATDVEIAEELAVSIHTVKSHMRNILSKLHLSHRHEAALYALREGLIDTPRSHTRPPSAGNGKD
ncbi:MAG: response regulator transcription factor [Anaerolineae bacterium]|nr:response regulator transcription factor [Anaerolineae bacterium]